ncbi:MAG TPA: VWA domain-containing protein, partial [Hyphomicrobiales bacterium]|nr:VWA domain-containing protein [Hyphomicrobiales bacterium]
VDVGSLYYVKQRLQNTANSAALAAAAYIAESCSNSSNCPGYQDALKAANSYVAANWNNSLSKGSAPALTLTGKCLAALVTGGAPCSSSGTAHTPQYNSLSLQLTVTAPTFFAAAFGMTSVPISVSAYAAAKGSAPPPLNVMLVIDTTASMNSSDPSCRGNTRISCALQGAQILLSQLWPNQDQVGLMVFPGLKSTSYATNDYTCGGKITSSMISPYYAGEGSSYGSPVYQIIGTAAGGSTDYRIQNGGSAPEPGLNPASNLAMAVKAGSCSAGIQALGGQATYYADVITAAQNVLTSWSHANGRQNVIIFLSDGDANADDLPSHDAHNICCETTSGVGQTPGSGQTLAINYQCQEAVTAAQNAASEGTWVYSIAYGASTSTTGSCQYDRSPVTPIGSKTYASKPTSGCATMTNIASDATKFYSDAANGCSSTANPSITSLNSIFQNFGQSLTYPRLISFVMFSGQAAS